MAAKKEISGFIKLQIKGGQANPAPPVGPALGQRGVNIMEFCKAFNDKTKSLAGKPVPVEITVYKDKKFDFKIKSPPASFFIREAAKLKSGSKEPGRNIVASITKKQAEEIAKQKMNDLNAIDLEQAVKIIAGSARSMGIEVKRIMSKRFKKLPEKTSELPAEGIEKLIPIIKKNCTTKFDESVDLSFQINNKQKKNEINIRTVVNLPGGSGKKVKVAVVCEDSKSADAKSAGADIVGGDDFIEKIKNGEINFEKLICTPSMMIKLSKLGKVLGPKGLMPNPKLGSVTEDLKTAITDAKSGQAEIRNDKDGNIGVSIGKKSFADDKLIKNYNAIIETLEKEKSNNTVKGELVKSAFITSTMGVSYKLKLGKSI